MVYALVPTCRDGDIRITGDDYHVLKYHDIRYYHDNAFGCFLYTFRAKLRVISMKAST